MKYEGVSLGSEKLWYFSTVFWHFIQRKKTRLINYEKNQTNKPLIEALLVTLNTRLCQSSDKWTMNFWQWIWVKLIHDDLTSPYFEAPFSKRKHIWQTSINSPIKGSWCYVYISYRLKWECHLSLGDVHFTPQLSWHSTALVGWQPDLQWINSPCSKSCEAAVYSSPAVYLLQPYNCWLCGREALSTNRHICGRVAVIRCQVNIVFWSMLVLQPTHIPLLSAGWRPSQLAAMYWNLLVAFMRAVIPSHPAASINSI